MTRWVVAAPPEAKQHSRKLRGYRDQKVLLAASNHLDSGVRLLQPTLMPHFRVGYQLAHPTLARVA